VKIEWKRDPAVTDYWFRHYIAESGFCSLCANTGFIDTRDTAVSPAGYHDGRVNYCICPNGQALRHHEHPLPS